MKICNFTQIRYKIEAIAGLCPYHKEKEIFDFAKSTDGKQCPAFLHLLYPYLFTFKNNGWFKWMREKNKVVITCPGDENKCTAEIFYKNNPKRFFINIIEMSGKCRFYQKDSVYEIPVDKFCFKLFCSAIQYNSLKLNNNITITCPDQKNTVKARILPDEN